MKKIIILIIFIFILTSCKNNSVNINWVDISIKTWDINLKKSFSWKLIKYEYFFFPNKGSDIENTLNLLKNDEKINLKLISNELYDWEEVYSIQLEDIKEISYDDLMKKNDYLIELSEKFNLWYDWYWWYTE